jgi:hypothetical protein
MKNWLVELKTKKGIEKWQMLVPVFILSLAVIATAYLSFQYFLVSNFPIGRDVIAHILHATQIQQNGIVYAFKISIYPLAYFAFLAWHKILAPFGLSWQRTFIFFECANLFLVSILGGILSYKIFKDWRVAAVAMVMIASSRWLNDSMRIGLMAETFGWVFFMASLIFLFEKKWLWFFIFAVILFFSHPLPFGVLAIIFSGFVIFWIITTRGRERLKYIAIPVVVLILFLLVRYLLPVDFHRIWIIAHTHFAREGERSVIEYITDSDHRRIMLYFLSFVGAISLIISLAKKKLVALNPEKVWLLLIFSFLAFLICFDHYLGIHYLNYRFYTYFEIAASILAAYMVVKISQSLWPEVSYLIFIPLVVLLIYPNASATKAITLWQLNTPALQDATPIGDQKALAELPQILIPNSKIYSHSSWHTWLEINGFGTLGDWGAPAIDQLYSATLNLNNLQQYLVSHHFVYVYFSSADPVSRAEQANFLIKIYDQNNVRVYQVK